jgi:hypothetical protein
MVEAQDAVGAGSMEDERRIRQPRNGEARPNPGSEPDIAAPLAFIIRIRIRWMPENTKARKLEVFALQCREGQKQLDYGDVFMRLAKAKKDIRQLEVGEKLLALPSMRFRADRQVVEFIAYEGPVGVNPLIFDAATGTERFESLTGKQVVATRTYGVIDLEYREAIIEYNHRGAKAHDIAVLLEETGRKIKIGAQFAVEFNPTVDDSFLVALERFGRIKLANMKVARPNFDWTDNYKGLNQVGADSNGRTVELTVAAHRNGSLSKDSGIIHYLRQMIAERVANLKGASVEGIREGEKAETSISLANFVVHQKIYVKVDGNGHAVTEDIQKKLVLFLESRRQARLR